MQHPLYIILFRFILLITNIPKHNHILITEFFIFVVMIYIAITQGKFTFPQTKFIITIINDWLWGSNFFSHFDNTKLADSMNGIVPTRNKIFWKFLPTFITPYSHQILSRNILQFCLIWDFELRVARYIYLESRKFGFLCILEFSAATRPLF